MKDINCQLGNEKVKILKLYIFVGKFFRANPEVLTRNPEVMEMAQKKINVLFLTSELQPCFFILCKLKKEIEGILKMCLNPTTSGFSVNRC